VFRAFLQPAWWTGSETVKNQHISVLECPYGIIAGPQLGFWIERLLPTQKSAAKGGEIVIDGLHLDQLKVTVRLCLTHTGGFRIRLTALSCGINAMTAGMDLPSLHWDHHMGTESNIGAWLTEPLRRRMIENITVRYVHGEMEPAPQCFADLAELSGAAVARTGQGHRNDIADAAFFLRHHPTSATDVVACADASLGEIATLTAISTDFLSFLS
jgi:hypothetical protein